MKHRTYGWIGKASFGPDYDHEGVPVFTAVTHGESGTQRFQLTFDTDEQMRTFVRDLCATFDVADADQLAGQKCYVLRCFTRHSEAIEGLESERTGKRITQTDWWRAHVDPTHSSPLARAEESLRSTIARLEQRLAEERNRLATLPDNYYDWSDP